MSGHFTQLFVGASHASDAVGTPISIDSIVDGHVMRFDSQVVAPTFEIDSFTFQRELTSTLSRVASELTKPLNFARIFPVRTDFDPMAPQFRRMGESFRGNPAVVGADLNDVNFPRAQGGLTEEFFRAIYVGFGYRFTELELYEASRAMAGAGYPLVQRVAQFVIQRLERFENDLFWNGFGGAGVIPGLLASNDVGTTALGSGAAWDGSATAAQIYADITQMAWFTSDSTDTAHSEPVVLVLPPAAYKKAATLQYAAGSDTTVLEYARRNLADRIAGIEMAHELTASKKACAFIRDENMIYGARVKPITQLPIVQMRAGVAVDYHLRCGGFQVEDSTAIRLFSGILA